jgi:hypothetical protein
LLAGLKGIGTFVWVVSVELVTLFDELGTVGITACFWASMAEPREEITERCFWTNVATSPKETFGVSADLLASFFPSATEPGP